MHIKYLKCYNNQVNLLCVEVELVFNLTQTLFVCMLRGYETFVGKARSLGQTCVSESLHSGRLRPYSKALDQPGKACWGQTLQLISRICISRPYFFHNIRTLQLITSKLKKCSCNIWRNSSKTYFQPKPHQLRKEGQCYKPFFCSSLKSGKIS